MRYEIFLQAYDYPEPHRAKAGDILDIRAFTGEVGSEAAKRTVCITVDVADPRILEGMARQDLTRPGEKRRFSIPLARLKSINSGMDLARVADPNDAYQPFMTVDRRTRRQLTKNDVPILNLFLDKRNP